MTKMTLVTEIVVIIYCIAYTYNRKQTHSKLRQLQLLQLLQLELQRELSDFSPQNGLDIAIFPIFAPAKSGEIDLARESAFFALFLDSESGQFI